MGARGARGEGRRGVVEGRKEGRREAEEGGRRGGGVMGVRT